MGERDEVDYWRTLHEDAQERLGFVASVAARGHVTATSYRTEAANGRPVLVACAWTCFSCGSQSATEAGPCGNPKCVPGEVARALARETPTSARIRRYNESRRTPNAVLPGAPPPLCGMCNGSGSMLGLPDFNGRRRYEPCGHCYGTGRTPASTGKAGEG